MKYSSFINLGKNYLWDRMADERYCNKAVMCILSYYACDAPMMQFLGALKRVIFHTGLIFHQCFCISILYISNTFIECKIIIWQGNILTNVDIYTSYKWLISWRTNNSSIWMWMLHFWKIVSNFPLTDCYMIWLEFFHLARFPMKLKVRYKLTWLERVCLHNGGGLNWSIPSILHSLGFAQPASLPSGLPPAPAPALAEVHCLF